MADDESIDGAGGAGDEPAVTEFQIVPFLFLTGASIAVSDFYVRFVGWVHLPDLGDQATERRIAVRFGMPMDVAESFYEDMRKKLRKDRQDPSH